MTYREAIQIQIAALMQIYDNANGLRDYATGEEKEAWNNLRGALPGIWNKLQRLDNTMTDKRASEKLRGNYIVKQDIETIS